MSVSRARWKRNEPQCTGSICYCLWFTQCTNHWIQVMSIEQKHICDCIPKWRKLTERKHAHGTHERNHLLVLARPKSENVMQALMQWCKCHYVMSAIKYNEKWNYDSGTFSHSLVWYFDAPVLMSAVSTCKAKLPEGLKQGHGERENLGMPLYLCRA